MMVVYHKDSQRASRKHSFLKTVDIRVLQVWHGQQKIFQQGTEAYIRHHLLHKSARKLLEMSEINGLSEMILRFLEEKCDMTVSFTFSVNILSTNY